MEAGSERARSRSRTFDALDGVRPGRAAFGRAARSADGRLWFANGVPLQTSIRRVCAATRSRRRSTSNRSSLTAFGMPAAAIVRLPPLTRDLQIDYVGLSFVAPQKVRFRYRLDGRDDDWQEPGTGVRRSTAICRPGTYRFRVIASNNDGVWNEAGRHRSTFVVAPAWYQTSGSWCCSSSLAAADRCGRLPAAGAARWRAALNARFDERLAERTRVARDLHDTLLQTVQGSKMVADRALDRRRRSRRTGAHAGASVGVAWTGQRGRTRGGQRAARLDHREQRSGRGVSARDR